MDRKSALLFLSFLGIASAQQQPWGQCGGQGWTGPTTCVSGWTCVRQSEWYSQCLEGSGGNPTTSAAPTTFTTSVQTTTNNGGNPPSNSCGSASVNQLVGFGAGTTGGGSGSGTTVSSCSALEDAIENAGVIKISGTLSGCGILDLLADTTVIGVGSNSGMTDGGFRVRRTGNVIIRNLKFHNPPTKKDIISLDNATKVWIDHCDFSSEGITGDKDYYDGLLDITHASDFVTVSWCKFSNHWKGSLVGHSNNNESEDSGHLRVTYHHNYFNNVNSRTPSVRFGTAHIYSSCYTNIPTSGINCRMSAQCLVESTHFDNVKLAITTDTDANVEGYATERNNIFDSSTKLITRTASFSPPYSYTVDSASCVCDLVRSKAGVGVVG